MEIIHVYLSLKITVNSVFNPAFEFNQILHFIYQRHALASVYIDIFKIADYDFI